jgi:thiamine biosynthesis protein ThiS
MIKVDNTPMPWSKEMTISTLLKQLDHVEFCAVVRLNGRLISSPHFETTPVPDHSKIDILPVVAGG